MRWIVLCMGCRKFYTIRINPNYNLEFTCIRIGCNGKLKKVKELGEQDVSENH